MTFGEKLKAIRARSGLSQEQLAEKLHVSRQAVAKWESNEGLPDTFNTKELAKLFGVTMDHLLDNKTDLPLLVMKETVAPDEYESIAGAPLLETIVKRRYADGYTIYPLIRGKQMTKLESVVDFIVGSGAVELADQFADLSPYYLVEKNGVQLLVNVTKEHIVTKELREKFTGKKCVVGNDTFTKMKAIL